MRGSVRGGEQEEMKAIIDQSQRNRNRITGVRMAISGRISGAARSQKRVIRYGRQQQQHTTSYIEYAYRTIETKYGTMGVKVQCAKEVQERRRYPVLRGV